MLTHWFIDNHGSNDMQTYMTVKVFFFYFVHCLYFSEITTFQKLDLLSSGRKQRTETLAVGPPGGASLRPGQL